MLIRFGQHKWCPVHGEVQVGVIHLLGKKSAEDNPSQPSHFRPLHAPGKLFIGILKQRWTAYMLETTI